MAELEKRTILGAVAQFEWRQADGGEDARDRQDHSLSQAKRVQCRVVAKGEVAVDQYK